MIETLLALFAIMGIIGISAFSFAANRSRRPVVRSRPTPKNISFLVTAKTDRRRRRQQNKLKSDSQEADKTKKKLPQRKRQHNGRPLSANASRALKATFASPPPWKGAKKQSSSFRYVPTPMPL